MFKKVIQASLDRYHAFRARKDENQVESKEEAKIKEERSLTYKEAIRKRSRKRRVAHAKYAGGRKFRIRNFTRFLPKVKIKDYTGEIGCRAFIVNHEDRDLKGDGLTFKPTGSSARKKHQRAIQRGASIEQFEWPYGGAMIRKIIDVNLTRAGK